MELRLQRDQIAQVVGHEWLEEKVDTAIFMVAHATHIAGGLSSAAR